MAVPGVPGRNRGKRKQSIMFAVLINVAAAAARVQGLQHNMMESEKRKVGTNPLPEKDRRHLRYLLGSVWNSR